MFRAVQTLLKIVAAFVLVTFGLAVTAAATLGLATLLAGIGLLAGACLGMLIVVCAVLAIANALDATQFGRFVQSLKNAKLGDVVHLRTVPKAQPPPAA